MSLRTLPLLFINLGGEMIYILDQRLRAQNIPAEKAKKVLHDITAVMFSKRFIDELFKPQELYSKKAMRTVFDRLAHASIMRLNTASMDKLYDLMTMAFKYQVSLSLRPADILLVTLNHMDTIRDIVSDSQTIKQQVLYVYELLKQHYSKLSPGEFMLIRQTLLNFFQDMHIRVSIFLKDKVQNNNGRFVIPISGPVPNGFDVPGTVKVYSENGNLSKTTQFNPIGKYSQSQTAGSYELEGNRMTKLGTNMYNISRPVDAVVSGGVKSSDSKQDVNIPNPMAKAQLDLLSKLIGAEKKPKKPDFRLNFFNTDEEEEQAAALAPVAEQESNVLSIDASKKKKNAELDRIMDELHVDSSQDQGDDNLLDLMDSAQ